MDFRSNKDYYHCREEYPDGLTNLLLPREEFHPFPKCGEQGWEEIDEVTRKAIIAHAENCMTQPVAYIPATAYMKYHREGDRSNDGLVGTRRRNMLMLALAECIEQKGRFMDALIDHIWVLCEETTWVLPAHQKALETFNPVHIDLFAAETALNISEVYVLLKERLEPLILRRVEEEIRRRAIEEYIKSQAAQNAGTPENKPDEGNE